MFDQTPGVNLWQFRVQGGATWQRGRETGDIWSNFVNKKNLPILVLPVIGYLWSRCLNFHDRPLLNKHNIIDLHLQKLFFHTFSNNFQATRCSFSGKLASDPESTVHISGCPEEETFDIVLMSKKVKWSSQTYFVIVLNYIFLQNLMIFLQTNLQFNSYRVDNAGKTIV